MADMTIAAHAKPATRRDYLWVLAVVAGFCLYDVWDAWTGLGNASGFPHGTGWTLTVIVELYWGYALFAWLAGAPGPRSRQFAMRSAAGVFALSLIGQGASYFTVGRAAPMVVAVFVRLLPVTVLALLAILIHMRHEDRAEAAAEAEQAARETAAAEEVAAVEDERVALRAEAAELRGEMEAAKTALDEAKQEAAEATVRAETLARKLATVSGRNSRTKKPTAGGRKTTNATAAEPVDARAEAFAILDREPGISGALLAKRVGKSDRWGQLLIQERDKQRGNVVPMERHA